MFPHPLPLKIYCSSTGRAGGLFIQGNEKCTSEKVLVDIGEPPDEPRFDVDVWPSATSCKLSHVELTSR